MSALRKMASFDDDIDFRKVWRIGLAISAVLLALSAFGLIGRGLVLGIDFEGGTSWDVSSSTLSVDEARDALRAVDQQGAKIQTIGRGGSRLVRVQSTLSDPEQEGKVAKVLADAAQVNESDVSVSTVGPSWGDQVTSKAQRALVLFFIVIAGYMALRLEWKMALGALIGVVHDIIISVGVYALLQIEITPATVIAFLTILGYSLYDTIVVFDRMQENANQLNASSRITYTDMASLSLNQVLMRSVNTTVTSLLPVLSMLLLGSFLMGAVALQEFALALSIGMLSGAYSSIIISTPLVAWLKEREPHNVELRARVASLQGPVGGSVSISERLGHLATHASDTPTRTEATASRGQAPTLSGRAIPPRPRKKGKKR